MSASFKGFHKAANFIHKSPKFAVSLLKLIKMWYSPLLLSIFAGGTDAPRLPTAIVSVTAAHYSMVIKEKQTSDFQYHLGNLFLFKAILIIPRFYFPLTL